MVKFRGVLFTKSPRPKSPHYSISLPSLLCQGFEVLRCLPRHKHIPTQPGKIKYRFLCLSECLTLNNKSVTLRGFERYNGYFVSIYENIIFENKLFIIYEEYLLSLEELLRTNILLRVFWIGWDSTRSYACHSSTLSKRRKVISKNIKHESEIGVGKCLILMTQDILHNCSNARCPLIEFYLCLRSSGIHHVFQVWSEFFSYRKSSLCLRYKGIRVLSCVVGDIILYDGRHKSAMKQFLERVIASLSLELCLSGNSRGRIRTYLKRAEIHTSFFWSESKIYESFMRTFGYSTTWHSEYINVSVCMIYYSFFFYV